VDYCNGGKPEAEHGGPIRAPAALTRTTPVSSTQYAVVPVEFRVTGVALTENPVSPEKPQADGTPAVNATVPFGVTMKPYPLFWFRAVDSTSSIK